MKSLYYILDEDDNIVEIPFGNLGKMREVEEFMIDGDRRTVAKTHCGGVEVSTVMLPLDHNFTGEGPPVLWETMVFGGRHDQDCRRYTSRENAVQGHFETVEEIMEVSSSWSQSVSKSYIRRIERLKMTSCWNGSEMSYAFVLDREVSW